MTLISVITPHYNYGFYLKEALDSILNTNQSDAFEIIIVDDGSTDHSHAILQAYKQDPRLRTFYQTSNRGIAATVNFAVRQAKGEFLHFFASDDLHQPGTLDIIVEKIRQFPEVSLFSADYTTFDESGFIQSQRFLPSQSFTYFTPQQVKSLLRHTHFWLPGHTLFIKKSVNLPYDNSLGPACDWLNNHTLALENGVGYLPQTLVKVRLHPRAYSLNPSLLVRRTMWFQLLDTFANHPEKYHDLIQSGICRMLGLKAIYLDLLKKPSYWKYLFPMLTRECEKQCFNLLGINREAFWLRHLHLESPSAN